MSYKRGTLSLANGVSSAVIPFPTSFSITPPVVLAWVTNQTDADYLQLSAWVRDPSAAGFNVDLSGVTDSANYVLNWIAGDIGTSVSVLQSQLRTVCSLARQEDEPLDDDEFILQTYYPTPNTKRVTWLVLKQLFPRLVTAPSSPTSEGDAGFIAFDDSYVYMHDGTMWFRVPREPSTTSWTDIAIRPRRRYHVALSSGVASKDVVFATPFEAGSDPIISSLLIENLTDAEPMFIGAVVTDRNINGFTVKLTAAPDTGNYTLHYDAYQP